VRSDRSITETTPANIEQVRLIADDDPCITIQEVQQRTGLSYDSTQQITTDHFKLPKIIARYTPKQLTDFQQKELARTCQPNLAAFRDGTRRFVVLSQADQSKAIKCCLDGKRGSSTCSSSPQWICSKSVLFHLFQINYTVKKNRGIINRKGSRYPSKTLETFLTLAKTIFPFFKRWVYECWGFNVEIGVLELIPAFMRYFHDFLKFFT
jgi:hypothetical protein